MFVGQNGSFIQFEGKVYRLFFLFEKATIESTQLYGLQAAMLGSACPIMYVRSL